MLQNPELIIQDQYDDLLFSDDDCSPIARPFIYRKNKIENNKPILCKGCNTAYADGILDCPYCLGTGTEWEQGISKGWLADNKIAYEKTMTEEVPNIAGSNIYYKYALYTDNTIRLRERDVVLLPALKSNGDIAIPIDPIGIYSVYEVSVFRSKGGNSEYFRYRLNNTIEHSFKNIVSFYGE